RRFSALRVVKLSILAGHLPCQIDDLHGDICPRMLTGAITFERLDRTAGFLRPGTAMVDDNLIGIRPPAFECKTKHWHVAGLGPSLGQYEENGTKECVSESAVGVHAHFPSAITSIPLSSGAGPSGFAGMRSTTSSPATFTPLNSLTTPRIRPPDSATMSNRRNTFFPCRATLKTRSPDRASSSSAKWRRTV